MEDVPIFRPRCCAACENDQVLIIKNANPSAFPDHACLIVVPPLFTTKYPRLNQGPIALSEGVPWIDPEFVAYLQDGPPAEAMVILLSNCFPLYSIASPLTRSEFSDVDLVSLIGTQIELRFHNRNTRHILRVFQSRPYQFGLRIDKREDAGPNLKALGPSCTF